VETLTTKTFRFSNFELDPIRRVLNKNGDPVALNPKAFDLLLVLVESRGEVLTKDDLLERVWPGQFVEEGNLKVHISALRKIFKESKNDHRFIVTVPGRGYSFVADVTAEADGEIAVETYSHSRIIVTEESSPEDVELPANRYGSVGPKTGRQPLWMKAILAGSFAAILVAVPFVYWYSTSSSTASPRIGSIAVMPFVNDSESADLEYLSDGMTDTLITQLAQLSDLNVKARASVFRYKGKDTNTQTIGKELSVQAVLLGRVIQRNEQISVFLELVDARTGDQIWGEQYIRPQADLAAMQKDIARDVSRKLRTRLSGADEQNIVRNFTENSEAHQLYLKGLFYSNKGSEEGYLRGLDLFQQAIDRDPNFARAHAGIAWAYLLASDFYLPNAKATPKARAAATRALEIDNSLAEGHFALAMANLFYDWNWHQAETDFLRAIELNPNYAPAHSWYGLYLAVIKELYTEAIGEGKKAIALDPLSLDAHTSLAQILMAAGQHDEAIRILKDAIELDNDFWWARYILGEAYERTGRSREAIAAYETARRLDNAPVILGALGRVYARSGRREEAKRLIVELTQRPQGRYEPSIFVAPIHDALGEQEQALDSLEQAVQERAVGSIFFRHDLYSDSIRSEPRFQNLVKRVGLTP
jgi:DNA-binding winged helix-turn-helix (wHTH) protein/TolB-like protein/Tfp pilus assembly protein PilF